MKRMKWILSGVAAMAVAASAHAAGGAKTPRAPEGGWAFEGMFGKFDDASVQRGYKVYREVCASCHSMDLVKFRNLGERGGPYYMPEYSPNDNPVVKAFAAEYTYTEIDDIGDEVDRPGRPADPFKSPWTSEQQARAANGGAYPPDMSVIVKARAGGADYIYSLLTGYPEDAYDSELRIGDEDQPEKAGTLSQPSGLYYNPYFAGDTKPNWEGDPRHAPYGGFLAMAPQLSDPDGGQGVDCRAEFNNAIDGLKADYVDSFDGTPENPKPASVSVSDLDPAALESALQEVYGLCFPRVEYFDGTYPSQDQLAQDVTAFLAWASEPKQEFRRSAGLSVMLFLLLLATLLWLSYRRIWRNVEH